MKRTTLRTLIVLTLVFDLLVLGFLLYDYLQNDSNLEVAVLVAFAVFLVISVILLLMKPKDEAVQEKVVEREVVVERTVEPEPAPVQFQDMGRIPPAPIHHAPPRAIPTATRPAASGIPFVYNGYTLYHRRVRLKNGGERMIYFFSKRKPRSGTMCAKPLGYHVGVNERTGLPFLKKGAGPDGEDLTPAAAEAGYRPQCSALTADGKQCRNSAREGSKYCGSHFGYQPKTLKGSAQHIEGEDWDPEDKRTDKDSVRKADTKAKVKGAPDTTPSVRRNWFGRREKAT